MIKRLEPVVVNEEQAEAAFWAYWRWDSHYWEEYDKGYFQCKFCKMHLTSTQGIDRNFPICKENPYIVG